MPVMPEAAPVSPPERSITARLASFWAVVPKHQAGLLIALIVIGAVWSIGSPYFLTFSNLRNVAEAQAVYGILAAGLTAVMMGGAVDLSIAGIMALAGMAAAMCAGAGAPGWMAIIVGIGTGVACGLFNSLLIVRIGVSAIVATLGTQFIFRGLAYIVNRGEVAIVSDPTITFMGRGFVAGVPMGVVIAILTFFIVFVNLNLTRWGRHVRAIGGNESAALRAGVNVARIRTSTLLLSAFGSSIAGLVLAGSTGAAYPQAGFGSEFIILGAVIVGGTSLLASSSSRGGIGGTILGVVLFGIIFNGFNLLGIPPFYQQVAQGVLLITAVLIDDNRQRRMRYV